MGICVQRMFINLKGKQSPLSVWGDVETISWWVLKEGDYFHEQAIKC